jgi:hypothetical protein
VNLRDVGGGTGTLHPVSVRVYGIIRVAATRRIYGAEGANVVDRENCGRESAAKGRSVAGLDKREKR